MCKEYQVPPIELLQKREHNEPSLEEDREKVKLLEETLELIKFPAKVKAVFHGNAVTRYEIVPPLGISVKRLEKWAIDIAYGMSARGQIRMEIPIPGSRAIALEIPDTKFEPLGLREFIESEEFKNTQFPLAVVIGKNIYNEYIFGDLRRLRNILIAGAADSGKSTFLHAMLVGMLYKYSPSNVKFALIDLKNTEFKKYNSLPNLYGNKIALTCDDSLNVFAELREEVECRYNLLEGDGANSIEEYNRRKSENNSEHEKLPYIVCVIDELAELLLDNKKHDFERILFDIIQKSKKLGIYFVLATQGGSSHVMSGELKANISTRIAFETSSQAYSRRILDESGAENLVGNGDMLYSSGNTIAPIRLQGAYVSDEEISAVVDYVRNNYKG